eukprot:g563.t2
MFDFDEIEETAEREGGWKEGADGETPVGAGAVEGLLALLGAQGDRSVLDFALDASKQLLGLWSLWLLDVSSSASEALAQATAGVGFEYLLLRNGTLLFEQIFQKALRTGEYLDDSEVFDALRYFQQLGMWLLCVGISQCALTFLQIPSFFDWLLQVLLAPFDWLDLEGPSMLVLCCLCRAFQFRLTDLVVLRRGGLPAPQAWALVVWGCCALVEKTLGSLARVSQVVLQRPPLSEPLLDAEKGRRSPRRGTPQAPPSATLPPSRGSAPAPRLPAPAAAVPGPSPRRDRSPSPKKPKSGGTWMRDTALEEPPRPAREPGPAPPVPTTKSASVNVQVESLKGMLAERDADLRELHQNLDELLQDFTGLGLESSPLPAFEVSPRASPNGLGSGFSSPSFRSEHGFMCVDPSWAYATSSATAPGSPGPGASASGGAAAQDEKGMFDFDDLEDTLPAMSSKVVPSSADMQVEVLFQHQGEAWTRSYQVASASTVLDLKKQIGDEVKSIQLCRFGRPLADGDLLKDGFTVQCTAGSKFRSKSRQTGSSHEPQENERLHFAFVGPRSPTATRQRPKPNTWAGDEEVTIVLDAALHLCQTRRVPKGTSVAGLKAAMAKEPVARIRPMPPKRRTSSWAFAAARATRWRRRWFCPTSGFDTWTYCQLFQFAEGGSCGPACFFRGFLSVAPRHAPLDVGTTDRFRNAGFHLSGGDTADARGLALGGRPHRGQGLQRWARRPQQGRVARSFGARSGWEGTGSPVGKMSVEAFGAQDVNDPVRDPCTAWLRRETIYPIHLAAKTGDLKVLLLLLASGADPEVMSSSGRKAWHFAKEANKDSPKGDQKTRKGRKEEGAEGVLRRASLPKAQAPKASGPHEAEFAGMLESAVDRSEETLFQQFLAGADPSRRLEVAGDASSVSSRVEDLPWWKYQRAIALWYCEWLDTYYDSGERRFLWRDELTQGFEAANLEELKEAAQRMRLDLLLGGVVVKVRKVRGLCFLVQCFLAWFASDMHPSAHQEGFHLAHKPTGAISKNIPLSEVNRHCLPEDCWVALNGKVYDLSEFMDRHPGGPTSIAAWAGKDASKLFNEIHKGVKIESWPSQLGNLGVDADLMSDEFWHTLREARIVEVREEIDRVLRETAYGHKADSLPRLLQDSNLDPQLKIKLQRLETQKRAALDAEDYTRALDVKKEIETILSDQAHAHLHDIPLDIPNSNGGIPLSEVARHNKPHDCWIAINKNVYDLTDFLIHHPEQRNSILAWAGRDATPMWDKIPGRFPSKQWMDFFMRSEWKMGDVRAEPQREPVYEQLKQLNDELRRLEGPSKEDIEAAKTAVKVPGGDDILLTKAGTDATKDFEVFEHSEKARVQRDRDMLVGQLVPGENTDWSAEATVAQVVGEETSEVGRYMKYKATDIAIGAVAWYLYKTVQNTKPLSQFTYSRALRHLHLIMAVGIFGAVGTAQAASYSEGQTRKQMLWWHKQTGLAMLFALVARFFLRMQSGIPPRFPGNPMVQMLETQSLRAFYVLALLLPVSGIANEYFLKWAPGSDKTGNAEDDKRNDRLAKQSIDAHKLLGKFLQFAWLPFHLGYTTFYHWTQGRGVVKKVAALAAAVEDEDDLAWRRDELTGHFTHWAPEAKGRQALKDELE